MVEIPSSQGSPLINTRIGYKEELWSKKVEDKWVDSHCEEDYTGNKVKFNLLFKHFNCGEVGNYASKCSKKKNSEHESMDQNIKLQKKK